MRYIYNQLIAENQTSIDYYGDEYELQQITKKGTNVYYTFVRKYCEPILVIPGFLEQYQEACRIFRTFMNVKKKETVKKNISAKFGKKVTVYDFGDETTFEVVYKNIKLYMEMHGQVLVLLPEFMILSGNIFGKNIKVNLEDDERFFKYYKDRLSVKE